MFGGGNMDLSNLPFASGSPRLDEKTIKALQVVGKAMNDRPAIKIQIIGSALADADDSGLKERLLMRDMRYAIYRDSASTVTRSLTEAQKEQAIKSIFSDYPVPNKPKLTDVSEMRQYLLAHQRVTRADLITLADQRAAAVRNYLIQKEKINPNRLFIVTSRAGDTGGATPGVSLGLQD